MAGFSPSDAALEGFRLTRERPGALLAWTGIYFLGIVVIALAMMLTLGQPFIEMAQKGVLTEDPEAMASALTNSWPAFIVVMLMTLALFSVMMGGIFRIILRPGETGFAHLRLGRDELRLAGINVLMFVLGVVFLALAIMFTSAAGSTGSLAGWAATGVVVGVGLWIGVRLSLVTPQTFETGKIDLRAAWRLTRGRFWPLFGMLVLAAIFYLMVWVLMFIIGWAVVELAGGEAAVGDVANLSAKAVVGMVVTLAMQMILQVLQIVMIYGPLAEAYKALRAPAP